MAAMALTELEHAVIAAIARVDPERSVMERQLEAAQLLKRDHTGVGFYTTLTLPDGIALLDRGRWKIEDMGHGFAHHPDLPSGASFILWVRDGKISTLEGYTNEGDWPFDETVFRVAS